MPSFVAAQCLNPNGSWSESDIQSSIKSRCLLSWFSLQPGYRCMTSDSANQINLPNLTPKYTLKEIEPEKKILAERKTALWEQCATVLAIASCIPQHCGWWWGEDVEAFSYSILFLGQVLQHNFEHYCCLNIPRYGPHSRIIYELPNIL